jgi:hypothetical protein
VSSTTLYIDSAGRWWPSMGGVSSQAMLASLRTVSVPITNPEQDAWIIARGGFPPPNLVTSKALLAAMLNAQRLPADPIAAAPVSTPASIPPATPDPLLQLDTMTETQAVSGIYLLLGKLCLPRGITDWRETLYGNLEATDPAGNPPKDAVDQLLRGIGIIKGVGV